jgi:hypothetical protein
MTSDALAREPTAISVAIDALLCALAATLIIATTAIVVAVAGLGDSARGTLRFGFGGVEHSGAQVGRIALHNSQYAAGTLLCALVAPRIPALAVLLVDLALASVLAFNAGLVGVAYGAYGWRAIAATAPHLPVEFAGVSLAGGAYLHACRRPLSPRAITAIAATCAALLIVAAFLETYVSMGGAR